MSRSLTTRLVLRASQQAPIPRCGAAAAAIAAAARGARPFSQTISRQADPKDGTTRTTTRTPPAPPRPSSTSNDSTLNIVGGLFGTPPSPAAQSTTTTTTTTTTNTNNININNTMAGLAQSNVFQVLGKSSIDTSSLSGGVPQPAPPKKEDELEPFHFHVYSHKHNTHITCTRPNREPIISMSCGNIGFRKSRRGTFDSAYSLTKYVLERLVHTGWPMKISRLELVLQGFGQGREAVIKMLMSPEGKMLRDKIVRVADSTRIKFGGTRSKKPRRL